MYASGADGKKKGKEIFKVKEKSGCCARNCLPGNCRPFELKLKDKYGKNDEVIFKAKREF